MWLVLTEPYDDTGAWLAEGLRPLAPGPVIHLTTQDFTRGASTAHGVEDGETWFHVRLASGQTIDSRQLRGVVNRVCALPPGLAFRLKAPQRDTAENNFGLPLLHLLHGFDGPVLNRPTAQGISGDFRLDFEWAALAGQVGFTRAPARNLWSTAPAAAALPDIVPVAVIGDQVVSLAASTPLLPAAMIGCCRRLAALSRNTLLALDLIRMSEDDWFFLRARPRASLIGGGPAVLEAVAHALAHPAASPLHERPARPAAASIHRSAVLPWPQPIRP